MGKEYQHTPFVNSKSHSVRPSLETTSHTGVDKHSLFGTTRNENSNVLPGIFGEPAFFQPRVQPKLKTTSALSSNSENQIQRQTVNPGEKLGQSTSGSTRHLVSDLSSPIVKGSEPKYELMQHGDEVWSSESRRTYKWTITDNDTSKTVLSYVTELPKTNLKASKIGNFKVTCTILSNGKPTSSVLSLDQKVVEEDASLTKALSSKTSQQQQTYRELINEFQTYIEDAANRTGTNGITPLFLASVLHIEITHRKDQRQSELDGVEENINEMKQGESQWPWEIIDRSLGVGQINMSTAAMVTGATKWVDQDVNNRSEGRSKTESNFERLSVEQKAEIFTLLKWPKSNIDMAAKLLSKLKNRSNRYPTLNRKDFGSHQKAASVIASEYNLGPSSTTAAQSAPSWYGNDVWKRMQTDALMKKYFKNE